MTFILAIQLEDSVIVAADNRGAVVGENGEIDSCEDETSKLQLWDKGIITGSGELTVIQRAIHFFNNSVHSKIEDLPKYLQISRIIRESEIEHSQVKTTKLLYSIYSDTGASIYWLEPNEVGEYQLHKCKNNSITLWVFNSDISCIADQLKDFYANLKPYKYFDQSMDWINHYLYPIRRIYKEQALHDPLMSESFDFFFQIGPEYISGHISNTQTLSVETDQIFVETTSI